MLGHDRIDIRHDARTIHLGPEVIMSWVFRTELLHGSCWDAEVLTSVWTLYWRLEGGGGVEQNKSGVGSLRNEPQLALIYHWL
jgi:hypothetical protein